MNYLSKHMNECLTVRFGSLIVGICFTDGRIDGLQIWRNVSSEDRTGQDRTGFGMYV